MEQERMNFAKLFASFRKRSEQSLQKINSGSVQLGSVTHKLSQSDKEIVLKLAQEVDLDEVQSFEIYWKYQRETTQNLLLNDTLLKTKA